MTLLREEHLSYFQRAVLWLLVTILYHILDMRRPAAEQRGERLLHEHEAAVGSVGRAACAGALPWDVIDRMHGK